MEYTKPQKPIEEFTDEELQDYENHLNKQIKLKKIAELEEATKNAEKPKPKKETSTDDNIASELEDAEEKALKYFDEAINKKHKK